MSKGNMNCPKCGTLISATLKFCPRCGCSLPQLRKSSRESLFGGLKSKVKNIGEKTTSVGLRAKGVVSQDKASSAVKNLLNVMTNIARDVRKDLPADMVKAVDLRASVSFIAFSVGVSIDLEKLQLKKVVIDEK
jgi:hypothetical protein